MLSARSSKIRKKVSAPFFWIVNGKLVLSEKNCRARKIDIPTAHQPGSLLGSGFSQSTPYIHEALYVQQSTLHGRGIFSFADLPAGKEIARVPALVSSGGEDSISELVIKSTNQLLHTLNINIKENSNLEEKSCEATLVSILKYLDEHVLTLMRRNWRPFSSKSEETFKSRQCKALDQFSLKAQVAFSPNDIAEVFEFNRFEVLRQNKRYCAIFPEASLFNHDCQPNVEIEILTPSSYSMECPTGLSSTCVLVARTCRKVVASEELLVSYFGDRPLNLMEKSDYMKQRWRFECLCRSCGVRLAKATFFIFAVVSAFTLYYLLKYVVRR